MLSRFSHVPLFATLWTVVFQALHSLLLLSMGFSRQPYWSGLPSRGSSQPRNLLLAPALAGVFFTTRATWKSHYDQSLKKKKKFTPRGRAGNSPAKTCQSSQQSLVTPERYRITEKAQPPPRPRTQGLLG